MGTGEQEREAAGTDGQQAKEAGDQEDIEADGQEAAGTLEQQQQASRHSTPTRVDDATPPCMPPPPHPPAITNRTPPPPTPLPGSQSPQRDTQAGETGESSRPEVTPETGRAPTGGRGKPGAGRGKKRGRGKARGGRGKGGASRAGVSVSGAEEGAGEGERLGEVDE